MASYSREGRAIAGKPSRINASWAAIGFALVLIVCLFILSALILVQSYREQISRAESAALSAAHIVSVHVQWLAETSVQMLERVHERLEAQTGDAELLTDIDASLRGLPGLMTVTVYDAEGAMRLSSAPPRDASIAERNYFRALAEGRSLYISPMLTEAEGEPIFIIARRLESAGEFDGVATIAVSNELLEEFWRSLNFDTGAAIVIVRDDGWLVARYPPIESPLNISGEMLFTTLLPQAEAGSYRIASSVADGEARIAGYRAVPGVPLVAIASVLERQVLEWFWGGVWMFLALVLPVAIALLVAVIWIARLLRKEARTREKLGQALEQNQVLFREIHHRVKNNLQAVSSLVQLQPLPPAAKQEMGRRIAAMVAVHEHIYGTDQFEQVEISSYVRRLVEDIAATYTSPVHIVCELAPVVVDKDHAMPIGLIVNEVVSNAYKHGFPDGRTGTITVSLKPLDAETGELAIRDDGVGFDPHAPSGGMGRRLIAGLVTQVGGRITVRGEGGAACVLSFPLARGKRDDEDS